MATKMPAVCAGILKYERDIGTQDRERKKSWRNAWVEDGDVESLG